jgi:hypothetical protein
MNTFLIISVFLIAVAVLAFRRQNRKTPTERPSLTEPRNFEGLFAEQNAKELRAITQAEAELRARQERELIIARAYAGDEIALNDAYRLGDLEFYTKTLNALVAQAGADVERLRVIAGRIIGSAEFPVPREFAEKMTEIYQRSLNRVSLVEMAHMSALTGDSEVYRRAIEVVMTWWRAGGVSRISAEEVLATIESGYWLLSSEARLSGPGFLLKKAMAEVRRELAAAARPSSSSSAK